MVLDFESVVLAASTGTLADEPAARTHADAVEFRMDLASEPTSELAAYDGELPVIATNRVGWEGGQAEDTAERLDALAAAATREAVGAVDVELAAIEDGAASRVVEHARAHGTAVIVSTHDFEETPARDRLRALLSRGSEHGDVAKLAVTAEGPADVLDLLSVTLSATRAGETVATMAMGEPGRHSRAVAPLYGSKIAYAPVDPAGATAPGQYDLATLSDLVGTLDGPESDESAGDTRQSEP